MKFQKSLHLMLLILFITFFFSCNNSEKNKYSTIENSETKTYTNRFENPKWIEKYSKLVTNYNELSGATNFSIKTYTEAIPKTGPKNGSKPNLVNINDYPIMKMGLGQTIAIEIPELDSISAKANTEFTKLMQLNNDAESYYDRGDYEDDNYAQGKKYHEEILPVITSFTTIMKDFGEAITGLETEIKVFELERDEKQGLMIRYHVAKTLANAKEAFMLTQVEDMKAYGKTNPVTIDVLIKKLKSSIVEAEKLAKDKDRLVSEFSGKANVDFYYEQFMVQANRMVKNLRELKKKLKTQNFTRRGSFIPRISTDGLPDTILNNYNELIENYNNLMS